MADIQMTQIPGTTHHYRALINVDPAKLTPTVDLLEFLKTPAEGGGTHRTVDAIITDPFLEDDIEAEFQANTSSVKGCKFKADSVKRVLVKGITSELTIELEILTVSPVVEQGAIEMKFEFLHSGMR